MVHGKHIIVGEELVVMVAVDDEYAIASGPMPGYRETPKLASGNGSAQTSPRRTSPSPLFRAEAECFRALVESHNVFETEVAQHAQVRTGAGADIGNRGTRR
jgi:hypothetical protein